MSDLTLNAGAAIKELRDLQVIQKESLTDTYMIGLYNGLELAIAILEGREPNYVEHDYRKYQTRRHLYDVVHMDEVALVRFALCMRDKLQKARVAGRGGWHDPKQCSTQDLSTLLFEEVRKGDPVDVANFAMFLHQRGDRIMPPDIIWPTPPKAKP